MMAAWNTNGWIHGSNPSPGRTPQHRKAGLLARRHPSPSLPSRADSLHSGGWTASSGLQQRGLRRNGESGPALHRLPVSASGRQAGGHLCVRVFYRGFTEKSDDVPAGFSPDRLAIVRTDDITIRAGR